MSATASEKPPKNMTGKTVDGVKSGQRKRFKKATNDEVKDRVEWLALKLAIQPNLKECEVNRLMKEKFDIEYRQTAEYTTRAKQLLQDRADITKEQAKKIGVSALLDTIQNGAASERNSALRLWADIFGYEIPKQLRVGDPLGRPLTPVVVAPIVQFIMPDNGRVKAVTNGNGHSKEISNGSNGHAS